MYGAWSRACRFVFSLRPPATGRRHICRPHRAPPRCRMHDQFGQRARTRQHLAGRVVFRYCSRSAKSTGAPSRNAWACASIRHGSTVKSVRTASGDSFRPRRRSVEPNADEMNPLCVRIRNRHRASSGRRSRRSAAPRAARPRRRGQCRKPFDLARQAHRILRHVCHHGSVAWHQSLNISMIFAAWRKPASSCVSPFSRPAGFERLGDAAHVSIVWVKQMQVLLRISQHEIQPGRHRQREIRALQRSRGSSCGMPNEKFVSPTDRCTPGKVRHCANRRIASRPMFTRP